MTVFWPTRLGCEAVKMAANGQTGRMVTVQGTALSSVPIQDVGGKTRLVTADHPWIKAAESVGLCLGVSTDTSLEEYVKKNHGH